MFASNSIILIEFIWDIRIGMEKFWKSHFIVYFCIQISVYLRILPTAVRKPIIVFKTFFNLIRTIFVRIGNYLLNAWNGTAKRNGKLFALHAENFQVRLSVFLCANGLFWMLIRKLIKVDYNRSRKLLPCSVLFRCRRHCRHHRNYQICIMQCTYKLRRIVETC